RWPVIANPVTCPCVIAQLAKERHIRPHANQNLVAAVDRRLPQLVAREAGGAAKQRVFRELLCDEQLSEVIALAGGRGAALPTPRRSQAHVPDQGQPDLRPRRRGQPLAATVMLGPSLPAPLSPALPGGCTAAEVRRAERSFVELCARRVDSRAVHGQRHP